MTETPEASEQKQPAHRSGRRRFRFWLLVCLGVLFLLPVLLLAAVLLALRSETGTAWVIGQVPGLEVENDRGSLFGQWQADRLQWRGYGVVVIAESPLLDWSPGCLLDKQLCVDAVEAKTLEVTQLGPDENSGSGGAVALPGVNLPLALAIGGVRLGPFTLNGSKVWDRLELDAGGSGADWTIDRAWYQLGDYRVAADGRIETRRDWPVNLELRAELPPPDGDAWALDATLSGSVRDLKVAARSRGYLDGELSGRLEPLNPDVPGQLRIAGLRISTGGGSLTGAGWVNVSGRLSWQADLELEEVTPGYWLPRLDAISLGGRVRTDGQLEDGRIPAINASWNLTGDWRANSASFAGRLDTASGSWELPELNLVVGDNRVQGSGTWAEQLRADLALSLPEPELFLPGLTGSVDARLVAEGTLEQHVADLRVSHAGAELELGLEGAAGPGWQSWRGVLSRGVIGLPEPSQQWQLASPADLAYSASGQLTLGNHCWRWQQSSLCADDQTLMPVPRIAYRLDGFPTAALAPLLPETLRWDARINGEIDFTTTEDGPDGRIVLDAGNGEFQLRVDDTWQPLAYSALTTEVSLKPQDARLALRLAGPELGQFALDLGLDPNSDDRNVDGKFRLDGLDVAIAGMLAGLEDVAGRINGRGEVSGPLMKPVVTGELHLEDGRVSDPGLPMPVEAINASVVFSDYSARISGRIRSNARSQTIVEGDIDWRQSPRGEITVSGSRVPLNLEPYAQLEVAPDLRLVFRDGDLRVSGQVGVPRGNIEIRGLPEQAVSVSDDEVIVGVEREQPVVRSLNMDVSVQVGQDRVTFAAFGVTGDLKGSLRIADDMDTRGTLQLVDGKYEAYGQALELRRARLLFVGNMTQPYLDIEAVRTVDTVVAGIRLTGPVESPETEVFSNPDMPQTEALSYVILGRAPRSQGDQGQMSQAALALGLTRTNKVTGQIGEEFGIRQLTLEAEGSGEQTSVVASGYLTDELSVRYGVGIFEPITTVALRYDLGQYFYLEAASGLAASLDIFYTRDF